MCRRVDALQVQKGTERIMRVLHSSAIPAVSPGILDQLVFESRASRQLQVPWDTALVVADGVYVNGDISSALEISASGGSSRSSLGERVLRTRQVNHSLYGWLHDVQSSYDLILLRYRVHDPRLGRFALESRVPLITVHHTLEVQELMTEGIVGRTRASAEQLIGSVNLTRVAAIMGVTDEIVRYERARSRSASLKGFVYPNGTHGDFVAVNDSRGERVELVFMASHFAPWHGLDVLLKSMSENQDDFVIHLVGTLSDKQIQLARLDDRVVVHGSLDTSGIRQIASRCWLAISSLALDRKGMSEACPLKVREYLAIGLPVFGSYKETIPSSFPYYIQGNSNISEILAVARKFQFTRRTDVSVAARPHINKADILKSTYAQLLDWLS